MENVDIRLLREIADLETTPQGAYNIRKNGELASRNTTANIDIVSKTDKSGIDIYVKAGTKHQSVHIPVIITQTGLDELVYNDFHIGPDCDIVIVAGCGIHNEGSQETKHDGVHTFYIGENSKVQYVEKHYGEGEGTGERVMNPQTVVYLEKGASLQMETTQLRGVDSTKRYTKVVVKEDAEAVITEKLLTHGKQMAESEMDVILAGEGASGRVLGILQGILRHLGLPGAADRLTMHIVRKLAHFCEYLLEGFLLMLCLRVYTRHFFKHVSWPMLGGLLTALTDETIQLFVPGRSGQVTDIWIDFSGVMTGLLVGLILLGLVRMCIILYQHRNEV